MRQSAAKLTIKIFGPAIAVVNALDDLKQAIQECAVECDLLDMIDVKEEGA